MLERYHTTSAAPARASTSAKKRRWPRSTSGWQRSAPRSARTCSPTSRATRWCWSEDDLAGLPDFVRRRPRAAAESAACRQACHHAVALQRRAVPAVLRPARPAREGVPRLDQRAATTAARPTTRRSSPRWWRCAPSAPSCSATDLRRTTGSTIHGQDARGGARPAGAGVDAARERALAERDAMQALIARGGRQFPLAPWDWRYYAEKLRKAARSRRGRDQALSPARQHDRGRLRHRHRLFGSRSSRSTSRSSIPTCALGGDAADGKHVGLFFGDYFARPSKRSGAWMTSLRDQEKLDRRDRPIIVNVMNFAKPRRASRRCCRFDDARTLFHEFGHALHGCCPT